MEGFHKGKNNERTIGSPRKYSGFPFNYRFKQEKCINDLCGGNTREEHTSHLYGCATLFGYSE